MELLQKVLNGAQAESVLYEWKETESGQTGLKEQAKELIEKLPDSKAELIIVITHPLFSLGLSPGLVKRCIKNNYLEIIENILKHKGSQINSKMLGRLFVHLLNCPMGYIPAGANYKPYKTECQRQGMQMKRSERIRYYLLTLAISQTTAFPLVPAVSIAAVKYFSFLLRYLLCYPNALPYSPTARRVIEFVSSALNSVSVGVPVDELYYLIEEFISYSEKTEFIYTVATSHEESFPTKPLESFSHIIL